MNYCKIGYYNINKRNKQLGDPSGHGKVTVI